MALDEMSEFCSSGSHMSCGAVCIFARALIWQEGPGVLISDLSLTFTWQFEAVGKGCVGEPVMSCLSPSGSLRAFLLMLEPALRGCCKLYLLILRLPRGCLGRTRDRANVIFHVKTNISINLGQRRGISFTEKECYRKPWVNG